MSISVVFGAAANAATGNFTISAQGVSGALSHSQNWALAIQPAVISALPRATYVRTDSTSAADAPFGEPHHRHVVYDASHKQVFLANRAMNRVEVFSSTSQIRLAQIAIPVATSADLSADGATVWIGTALDEIIAIDSASLTIRNRYTLTGLMPIPNAIFNRPVEVLSLSNGKSMVRLRQPVSSEALLALWDPASNSLTNLTPVAPAVFQQGVGVVARSGDHSRVLVAANDSSGELVVFDSGGNALAGPLTLGAGLIPGLAVNSDGSRNAVVFVTGSTAQIFLLDASLKQVGSYSAAALHGVTFSRDGKQLYAAESSSGTSFITVLDGQTGQLSVSGATQILANSPPSAVIGPVNLTAYFQNSWLALAPDAFSYGPQILQILPNAETSPGGDSIQIYGYGFGNDPAKITVKVGSANATVQMVENLTNLLPSRFGLQLPVPPRAHHVANTGGCFWQSGPAHHRSLRFCRLPEIISVLTECAFLFETGALQIPDLRSAAPAHRSDQHRSRRCFRFTATDFSKSHPASRRASSHCWTTRLGPDSRRLTAHCCRFWLAKCLSSRSREGNGHHRFCRWSFRLHELGPCSRCRHQCSDCFRRPQRRRRFLRSMFHLPRTDESHCQPPRRFSPLLSRKSPASPAHRSFNRIPQATRFFPLSPPLPAVRSPPGAPALPIISSPLPQMLLQSTSPSPATALRLPFKRMARRKST
jgi:DNA-binding beta-propeller fold protein YncE